MVFALDKFISYLLGTVVIVHTNHASLWYMMSKKDEKLRLIIWFMLLKEFDFVVKDRKGRENQVSNHLSRFSEKALPNHGKKGEINDMFPQEKVLAAVQTSFLGLPTLLIIFQVIWYLRMCHLTQGRISGMIKFFWMSHTCIVVSLVRYSVPKF